MRTLTIMSFVLALACAHAREAEDPAGAQASAQAEPEAQKKADAEGPADAREEKQGPPAEPGKKDTAQGKAAQQKEGRVAGGAEDPGEVPVASSPSGLLKPGAEKAVRDKLGVKAGGSLRQALQKYQTEHDLPSTGILDQRTAEALGLETDDVFERADGQ